MKRLFTLVCLLFTFNCSFAASVRDVEAISSIIKTLFDSLGNGDTEVAYSLNTEDTRNTFGSAGNFLATIKEHYLPLYQHDAATIVDISDVKDSAVATSVLIVDSHGGRWMAVFVMKRGAQSWQIESCFMNAAASFDDKNAI